MACPKCALSIKDEIFTVCEGVCCKSFHAACVGLSVASIDCLKKKNVIWLCDDCLESFFKHITEQYMESSPVKSPVPSIAESEPPKTLPGMAEELTDIKSELAKIKETLAAITEGPKQSLKCAPRHSTPICSPKSHGGSKIAFNNSHCNSNSTNDHSCSSSVSTRNDDNSGTFSLFLTNIDTHVTEADISTMVARSLGVKETDAIYIKKLVPRWKASDTLEYISFKVRMDDKFKPTALRTNTWPTGIAYREFIERPRITWKPAD